MAKGIWLVLVGSVLLIAGCRSAKKIQNVFDPKDGAVVVKDSTGVVDSAALITDAIKKLRGNYIDYESFSAKIKVDFAGSDGKKNEVSANLRMKKDSAIWVSITAVLGIEALRVMITPDSIRLMDKLNKQYEIHPFSYLTEVTKIPLSFSMVQDLLIGNPVYLDSNISSYHLGNNIISLLHVGSWYKNLVTLNADNYTIQSSKIDDKDEVRNRTGSINYSNYEQKNDRWFSTFRNLTLAEKTKIDIKLDFKQYAFNEALSFPFSIPRNYTRN
ncbi:MAG TPA: DUF4292 domain-containing protein [Parasegetibacter sp.]|jgi:hypothetical protein